MESGWGENPPPKYPDWYKWDEAYFQTLLDCEGLLKNQAGFDKDGQHVIEEAAKRNNTELFYYLLMQAWDKAGYYGMVDLGKTKHINPKSLPKALNKALSMSLFWAVQYGNPVMADIALHYGADSEYPSPFSGVTPMELAVYYGNDMIMDIMEERDKSVKHRLSVMRKGKPQTPTIDRYYQEKAAYITENIESKESRKRECFLNIFHRLKKNTFIHADIQKFMYEQTGDDFFLFDGRAKDESFITGKKHNLIGSFKTALAKGEKVNITVPKKLMRKANLTPEEYSQLLKEITIGALLGQTVRVGLYPSEDENNSIEVRLPSAFRDTFTGQIAMDTDYLMKTIVNTSGTYFPIQSQLGALGKLKKEGLYASSSLVSENLELALAIYRRSGADILTDDRKLKKLSFTIEKSTGKDRDKISKESDPSWHKSGDYARFMFDGEGRILVYNPKTKQVSVDLHSVARYYVDYKDKEGGIHPQTVHPLSKSCMGEFNKTLPKHAYTAHKIARLDLVYQLTAIVLAFIEEGRVPSFTNFPALQSSAKYETPWLLPPIVYVSHKEIHGGNTWARLFGGVGELGNLGSSENFGSYKPLTSRWNKTNYEKGQDILAEVGSRPVQKYEVGIYKELVSKSHIGDGLDIHHVIQKHPAYQLATGYEQKFAPAIALPREEHRQIPPIRGNYSGDGRSLLAKDLMDLRSYTNAPNTSLQQLSKMNKTQYPDIFNKYK